jgi:hypothetical protein
MSGTIATNIGTTNVEKPKRQRPTAAELREKHENELAELRDKCDANSSRAYRNGLEQQEAIDRRRFSSMLVFGAEARNTGELYGLLDKRDSLQRVEGYRLALADLGLPAFLISTLLGRDMDTVRVMTRLYLSTAKMFNAPPVVPIPARPPAPAPAPYPSLSEEEKAMIRSGKFIEAIKDCRCRTGLGLKEAKDLCDDWRSKNGLPTHSGF